MRRSNGNQFLSEELVTLRHYDKKTGSYIETEYPKVGGRLRLAHENNSSMNIETEIIQYDGSLAVVRAVCAIEKGSYAGIGMASIERDEKIAPAILELAETRAIARALRFAGYGAEYCSAEEVSHLQAETGNHPVQEQPSHPAESGGDIYCPASPASGGYIGGGGGESSSNNNDSTPSSSNGNGRLSSKQYNYLLSLGTSHGLSKQEMDQKAIAMYGSAVAYLKKAEASTMIQSMRAQH